MALFLLGCGGPIPASGTSGLLVQDRRLEVDPALQIQACAEGALLMGGAAGYVCGALPVTTLSASAAASLDRAEAGISALAAALDAQEAVFRATAAAVAAMEADRRSRQVGPGAPSTTAVAPCVVDQVGAARAYCPLSPTDPPEGRDRFLLRFQDTDGTEKVVDRCLVPSGHVEWPLLAGRGPRVEAVLGSVRCPFEILEASRALSAVSRGDLLAPPALTRVGGALYVDGGGDTQAVDALGRVWEPDLLYLARSEPATRVEDFGGSLPLDTHLLDQPGEAAIPNRVLLTERWCGCNLHYAFRVPEGRYRVRVYLSEDCDVCTNLGAGTAVARHTTTITVEDQSTIAYDAADAADGVLGNDLGALHTSSRIEHTVQVRDGILDLTVVDLDGVGAGVPPGDAVIKAFSVERIE
ncbi:MAG: hypothetical protein U1E65_01695 [Myxococcota bacterium]